MDGDAGVIFTSGATLSAELIPAFLGKVAMDVPCQLRTVQAYGESRPMVIDVIYEDGTFLWKMRDAGEITQRCFSYIVTDGTDLYLSNGADWDAGERYGDKRVFLVPPMAGKSGYLMWSPWKRTAWRKTRPGTASGPMTGSGTCV